MKKIIKNNGFFNSGYEASSLGAKVVPGVFKITTDKANVLNPVVVVNQLPNENNDNYGGWNFCYTATNDSNKLKVSKKPNPLYKNSTDTPKIEPLIPANYVTAAEAVAAFEAGTGIADA